MTNNKLILTLTNKTGLTQRRVKQVLKDFTDIVEEELAAGNKVSLTGFGVFWPAKRAARRGVNPQTGKEIYIPEMPMPGFRAGNGLKAAVREKSRAHV